MKILFFCFISIVLFSCSKEKTPQPINIVGKWKMTESYDNYKNNSSFQWNTVPDSLNIVMEFSNHNGYHFTYNNTVVNGNYSLDNNTRKVTITQPDGTTSNEFYINENNATQMTVSYLSNGNTYKQKFKRIN